jgi:hypothetical protein
MPARLKPVIGKIPGAIVLPAWMLVVTEGTTGGATGGT